MLHRAHCSYTASVVVCVLCVFCNSARGHFSSVGTFTPTQNSLQMITTSSLDKGKNLTHSAPQDRTSCKMMLPTIIAFPIFHSKHEKLISKHVIFRQKMNESDWYAHKTYLFIMAFFCVSQHVWHAKSITLPNDHEISLAYLSADL